MVGKYGNNNNNKFILSPKIPGSSVDSHKKDTTYTKHTIGHSQYATQNNSCKYKDKNKINM